MKFGRIDMRILLAGALALLWAAPLWPQGQQPQQTQPSQGANCGNTPALHQTTQYYDDVVRAIHPPFPASQGITILVGDEKKLVLHTDGEKFQLWTDTLDMPAKNIWTFLNDLDDACHLPLNPADVVGLLKVKWQSQEISRAEFERLHTDFMTALAQYASGVQKKSAYFLATRAEAFYLDASDYTIVYDNTYQHFQIQAPDVPDDHKVDPMIEWVHELQKAAEDSFHRPFGREK
jgi:hypothetical protein